MVKIVQWAHLMHHKMKQIRMSRLGIIKMGKFRMGLVMDTVVPDKVVEMVMLKMESLLLLINKAVPELKVPFKN